MGADGMPNGSLGKLFLSFISFAVFHHFSICYSIAEQINAAAPQILGEEGHKVVAWRKFAVVQLCVYSMTDGTFSQTIRMSSSRSMLC
jgi:hypothetical protein